MLSDVLSLVDASVERRAPPPPSKRVCQEGKNSTAATGTTSVLAHDALVTECLALENRWWASPNPAALEDAFALSDHAARVKRRCLLSPRFVRCCLDAAAGGPPPMLTAWALHEAHVIPLLEWVRALRLPDESVAWGAALAELHTRAKKLGNASSPSRLLHALRHHLVGLAAGSTAEQSSVTKTAAAPLVAETQECVEAILEAYLLAGRGATADAAGELLAPLVLERGTELLRAVRSCVTEPSARARFASKQLQQVVSCLPVEGSAKEETSMFSRLVRAAPANIKAGNEAPALSAFALELTGALGSAQPLFASLFNGPTGAVAAPRVHAGRWLRVAMASSVASANVCQELCEAIRTATLHAVNVEPALLEGSAATTGTGTGTGTGAHAAMSTAALILVAYSVLRYAADPGSGSVLRDERGAKGAGNAAAADSGVGGGYSQWLLQLAKGATGTGTGAAAGSSLDRGAEGGVSKRAALRLTRALSDLVPGQSMEALRVHLKLSASLQQAWAAHPEVADPLNQYQALLRSRQQDLKGSETELVETSAADRRQAQAQVDAALAKMMGGDLAKAVVPTQLSRLRFLNPRAWKDHIVPILLAEPPRPPSDESLADRQRRLHRLRATDRLVHLLREQGFFPRANAPKVGLGGVPKAAAPSHGARADGQLPTDWSGLLAALPGLAADASKDPNGRGPILRAALSRMQNALRPPSDDGDAGAAVETAKGKEDGEAAPGGESLEAGDALRSAGGSLGTLLGSLLHAFAQCLHAAGATAASEWPALVVASLLWEPQKVWPGFHRALFAWLRAALSGLAGASERPLALLLLHLMARDRAECARQAPARCPHCEATRTFMPGVDPARSPCDLASLIGWRLPIAGPLERSWTMRLGAACLEAAATAFECIDAGGAKRENWQLPAPPCAPPEGDRSAAVVDVMGGEAADGGMGKPVEAGGFLCPGGSRALLPGPLLQLLQWLAAREGSSGGAGVSVPDEAHAASELRRCLQLPGVAELVRRVPRNTRLEQAYEVILESRESAGASQLAVEEEWAGARGQPVLPHPLPAPRATAERV